MPDAYLMSYITRALAGKKKLRQSTDAMGFDVLDALGVFDVSREPLKSFWKCPESQILERAPQMFQKGGQESPRGLQMVAKRVPRNPE